MKPWRAVKENTQKANISKKLCFKAIATKYHWSLLKTMFNDKKLACIPLIFMITNLFQILVKKLISLIIFLQSNALLLKITVFSTHQLSPLPIGTWKTLNSRRMMLKESSVNSILIKLKVMI